jgi:hypothetical protein
MIFIRVLNSTIAYLNNSRVALKSGWFKIAFIFELFKDLSK